MLPARRPARPPGTDGDVQTNKAPRKGDQRWKRRGGRDVSWIARGQAYREPVTPPEAPEREGHMDKNHPDRPLPSGRHSQRKCDPHSTWRPSQEGRPPPPHAQTYPHTLIPAHRQTAAQRDRQMAATQQDAYRDQPIFPFT